MSSPAQSCPLVRILPCSGWMDVTYQPTSLRVTFVFCQASFPTRNTLHQQGLNVTSSSDAKLLRNLCLFFLVRTADENTLLLPTWRQCYLTRPTNWCSPVVTPDQIGQDCFFVSTTVRNIDRLGKPPKPRGSCAMAYEAVCIVCPPYTHTG